MLTDLKVIRLDREMTQSELAELSKISDSTISSIEYGKQVPRVDTVCQLAIGLSISPLVLFELMIRGEKFSTR